MLDKSPLKPFEVSPKARQTTSRRQGKSEGVWREISHHVRQQSDYTCIVPRNSADAAAGAQTVPFAFLTAPRPEYRVHKKLAKTRPQRVETTAGTVMKAWGAKAGYKPSRGYGITTHSTRFFEWVVRSTDVAVRGATGISDNVWNGVCGRLTILSPHHNRASLHGSVGPKSWRHLGSPPPIPSVAMVTIVSTSLEGRQPPCRTGVTCHTAAVRPRTLSDFFFSLPPVGFPRRTIHPTMGDDGLRETVFLDDVASTRPLRLGKRQGRDWLTDLSGSGGVTRRASAPDITRRRLSLPADRRAAGEPERNGPGTGHRDLQNALQVIQKTIVAMSEPRPPPRTTSISSIPDAGSGGSPKYPGQMERGQMADYEATFMALERENEILKSKLQNAMRREIQALRTSKKLARDNHKLKQVVLKQEEAGHGQQGHLSLPKHANLSSAARCRSPIDMEAPMVVGNGQQQQQQQGPPQLPIHHERSNSGDDTLSYPRDDSDSAIVMESDMSQRHPSDSDDTSGSGDDRHLEMSRTRKGQTPARSVSVVIERQRGLHVASPAGQGNKNIYGQLEITGDRHDVRFPWQRDVATQCDFNADVMCTRCAMVIREEDEGVEKENMPAGQPTVVRREKSKIQMARTRPASADWSTRYTRTLENSNFRPANVARPRLLAEELTDDVQRRRAEAARMSFARRTNLSMDAASEPLQVVNLREPGQGRRGERPMSDGWADQKLQYGSVPSESLYFQPSSDSPRVVRRQAAESNAHRMRPMSADWSNVSTSWGPPVKPQNSGSDPEIRARVFAPEAPPPMDFQQPESKHLNRTTSLPPAAFRDQHKQLHGVGVSTVEEEDDGPSADDSSPKRANKGSASPNTDDGSSDDNSAKGTDDDTPSLSFNRVSVSFKLLLLNKRMRLYGEGPKMIRAVLLFYRKRRQKRALRRRSSLIVSLPGLQVSPGDLLVCEPGDYHDGQAAIAALKDRHRGSAANLLEDEKKTKSAWSFLKTNFTKSKEKEERKKNTALEVALTTIKQRDLGEHHLYAYKRLARHQNDEYLSRMVPESFNQQLRHL
ncbi:prolactin receptor [Branchiostoma belcheri]|nr:prolactin receptor [Branchiostoma belcheri]